MARARRQLAIAHRAQFAAERLLGDADPELVPQPLAKIDDAPAHDAVHRRDRPALDHCCQRRPMRLVQPRRLARRLAVDQPIRAICVEPQHPVPDDLARHAADLRRLGTRGPVIDRREGEQAAHLVGILARARRQAGMRPVIIRAKWDRHGETSRFASLKSAPPRVGEAPRVGLREFWYERDDGRGLRRRFLVRLMFATRLHCRPAADGELSAGSLSRRSGRTFVSRQPFTPPGPRSPALFWF